MRILPLFLILWIFLLTAYRITQSSPHGSSFRISCKTCHSTKGWQLDREIYSFDHNLTKLPLSGQHMKINCRDCHPTLVFQEAKSNCIDCHKDVHQSTVGAECSRCHTPESWLVPNIIDIHRMSRFPLLGPHMTADCSRCHRVENPVRFDVAGVNCIDCHRPNYFATTRPNHVQAGFSEDCAFCHKVNAFQWEGAGINHNFFPLVLGHASVACTACHSSGNYSSTSRECSSCHLTNFNNTTNPNHRSLNFSTNCTDCHTTNPGWKPATYRLHDSQYFPIYSGKHNNVWSKCTDCHTQPSNYSVFSCITCHEHSSANTDGRHSGVNGYSYTATSCYACHKTGTGGDK